MHFRRTAAAAQADQTPICMQIWSGGAVVSLEELNPMTEITAAFANAARSSVNQILWESDYPHADTPFPKAQMSAKAVFDGIPRDEVELITHKNAEELFHFPLSRELIAAYSGSAL